MQVVYLCVYMKPESNTPPPSGSAPLRVALVYAVVASLWILGSDWLLGQLVSDAPLLAQISAYKGWAFVAVTSLILHRTLRRLLATKAGPAVARPAAGGTACPLLTGPMLAAVALVLLVTGAALRYEYQNRYSQQAAQVEAVAQLRSSQVAGWLGDRLAPARFARSSQLFANLALRIQDGQDPAALAQLQERLAEMSQSFSVARILVLNAQGEELATSTPGSAQASARAPAAVLRAALQRALRSGEIQLVELHRDVGDDQHTWHDIVAPLVRSGSPARAAMVFRQDAQAQLLATLRSWPVHSATGTSLLVRRQGQDVVGITGAEPRSLQTPDLLAAKVLRGDAVPGRVLEGVDFRGVPVVGAVVPVPGSEWFVVARISQQEMRSESLRNAPWIVAAGFLGLLVAVAVNLYLSGRRALARAHVEQAEQQMRLRSMALVQAIADGSTDAIFAKD